MDIDLESCLVGFLIGVAIYLLLNRVFMVEGVSFDVKDQYTCQNACDSLKQGLTCEWTPGCVVEGCNIGNLGQNCRACSPEHPCSSPGQSPGQSPSQSPSQSPGQSPSQSPGQSPSQSPGQSPSQSPGQSHISGEEFIKYLDFTKDALSINWNEMKDSILYSLIICSLMEGENVTFTEPSNKITNVTKLKMTPNSLDLGLNIIRLTLPLVELLKFIDLSKLKEIDVSYTGITGDISVFNKAFPSLEILFLNNNDITGDISVFNSTNFPSLNSLNLNYNYKIKGDISSLSPHIKIVMFRHTSIYGNIRDYINSIYGNGHRIDYIDFSHTGITGNISDLHLVGYWAPKYIYLSNTSISGDISDALNQVDDFLSLISLKLNNTELHGDISVAIRNLMHERGRAEDGEAIPSIVAEIDLSNTRITGDVGNITASFTALKFLDVSNTIITQGKKDPSKCVKI
jgi:hypothetical protein